jgi:hypothetical protein
MAPSKGIMCHVSFFAECSLYFFRVHVLWKVSVHGSVLLAEYPGIWHSAKLTLNIKESFFGTTIFINIQLSLNLEFQTHDPMHWMDAYYSIHIHWLSCALITYSRHPHMSGQASPRACWHVLETSQSFPSPFSWNTPRMTTEQITLKLKRTSHKFGYSKTYAWQVHAHELVCTNKERDQIISQHDAWIVGLLQPVDINRDVRIRLPWFPFVGICICSVCDPANFQQDAGHPKPHTACIRLPV